METQNRYTYDGLGRQTEAKQTAGNGDGGPVLATTTTSYGGDRTTVIPPTGGTATTTLVDARGRTTELRQHHTPSATSAYDTTRYKYTPRGELSRLTDPAGSVWTYTYDLLGRQKEATDPDKGKTTSTYDDRGQLTTTKDARPDSPALWHGYDNLGRQTELREGSATGTLRASWTYDTITNAKGQLAQSTRYDHGNAYTTKVVAYDRLYRPLRTSLSVPAAEGALKGDYLTATTYNSSGTVQGIGYPKAGSLSAATVSYTYQDATLRPVSVSSSQGIKATTSYYLTGKPSQYELSKSGGKKTWVTDTYEWGTQRLESSRVDREDVAGVDQNSTYHYDEAGNVRSVSDVSRDGTDTQCFAYDYLARLTEAWTQNTTGCAATPSGSVLGGPAPYWSSYGYDLVGDRTTETLHDTTGDSGKDKTRTYDYPEAGSPHPHAVSSITTTGPTGTAKDSYGYDETGNTTTRTLSGTTRTNDWDAEGHLAKVTEPGAGGTGTTTEYLYDADGNRLIARTPTETTLYLGATEITLAKGSTTPKPPATTTSAAGRRPSRPTTAPSPSPSPTTTEPHNSPSTPPPRSSTGAAPCPSAAPGAPSRPPGPAPRDSWAAPTTRRAPDSPTSAPANTTPPQAGSSASTPSSTPPTRSHSTATATPTEAPSPIPTPMASDPSRTARPVARLTAATPTGTGWSRRATAPGSTSRVTRAIRMTPQGIFTA